MNWKNLARAVHACLPEGPFRARLSALAYRWMYRSRLVDCRWIDGRFVVRTRDGIEVHSVREFDPAPLVNDFEREDVPPGAVALDVGANIGAVACWLARRVGSAGQVVVFEPDDTNLAVLRRNVELNAVENVVVVPRGAWDREGELEFLAGGGYTSSFCRTNYVARRPDHYRRVRVAVTTIDAEVRRLGLQRVDLIKMDIEGGEGPALRGARATLERFRPMVIVESHVVDGRSTLPEIREALAAAGYAELEVRPDPETSVVIARGGREAGGG
ncbi:MAG: FkbM family methyltransferase [Kiritimatiellae bacterium]|nr:FkbM family methyltransferase [Kiritimatiellia bacterium]